jgi:hypothetical protein
MVSALCAVTLLPATAMADNPIIQTIYTADPAPLVYNGRVYLYTGHDEAQRQVLLVRARHHQVDQQDGHRGRGLQQPDRTVQ